MNEQITSAAELDALPVHAYWLCSCGYFGVKVASTVYRIATPSGRNLTADEVVESHLPLTVLYRPDQPQQSTVAEAKAEAWSEGWIAASAYRAAGRVQDGYFVGAYEQPLNPYRADRVEREARQ